MWTTLAKRTLSQTKIIPRSFPVITTPQRHTVRPHSGIPVLTQILAAFRPRAYSSVAEAVSVSSEEDASPAEFRKGNGRGVRTHFQLMTRQVKIETEAWESAAREYKELLEDMFEHKLAPNLPYVKALFLGWFQPLKDAITREQEKIREGKVRYSYSEHFVQLPSDMMAVITMHKLMAVMMSAEARGSARVITCACAIGEAVEQEIRIYTFMEKTKGKKGEKERLRKKVSELIRKQRGNAVRKIVRGQEKIPPWGVQARAKLGTRLLDMLIQTAHIQSPGNRDAPPDVRPAFVHTHAMSSSMSDAKPVKQYGVINCDPLVLRGLDNLSRHVVIPYMPMLVPPLQWAGYDRGAHFFLPSYVMRTHGALQQREALRRVPVTQLKPIFEALDTLGSTKWRINKRVLRVVDRIWSSGGRLGGLVDRDDIPFPEKPDTNDEKIIKNWKFNVRSVKKLNKERYSLRCDVDLKLTVAKKMQDEEGFYYPHNVDFRGRAYPMHPYLNHLGSDLCRGVLEFAEGRPLGKAGINWLKIQIANLVAGGVDKLSFEGRIAFVDSKMEEVFDSAENPLEGGRWWLEAEDPFQCLAACINLTEALKNSSPEAFVSHIPIHMDGSCNGLQHYAALGRDSLGAESVNLMRGEKPADVYSGIAARVLAIMENDAQKDPEAFPQALLARVLLKEVNRKLVKQTVMTSVYGVTYIGARDQIKRKLKDRGTNLNDREIFSASCYAAKVTLTALGQMFEAAREIMNWLGECARTIAAENESVRWTTPLGLPVVQPYRKMGRLSVRTSLQVLSLKCETENVMRKRQRTAFAPNFVHSLDGTHMMMTALACKKAGLRFAGVHDSYWTHACDVDELNKILREKFVELYEQPILEDLLEDFRASFPSLVFPPLPGRGDFNLKDVLDSPYFFN